MKVENEILHEENESMKATIQEMNKKENELFGTCEVEKMTVDSLQGYLKLVENDYRTLMKEGDKMIHQSKEERHE